MAVPSILRMCALIAIFAIAAANALLVFELKAWIDRGATLCEVSERALRSGSLRPDELCFGPFGFVGWHLFRYYRTHEGRANPQIDGFNLYVRPGAVQVGQYYSRSLRRFSQFDFVGPADLRDLIAVGDSRCLWFYPVRFYLLRPKLAPGSPSPLHLGPDYRPEDFPLTELEWQELIQRRAPD